MTPALPRTFRVAPADRAARYGRTVVGSSPGAVVRVTPAGEAALDMLWRGATVGDAGDAAGRDVTPLVRVLLDAGAVHPRPKGERFESRDVTVGIPVKNAARRIGSLVRALAPTPVVVVDDGSTDGSGEEAAAAGATVVRHAGPRGPAAARNAALGLIDTPLVAFVDADTVPASDWWSPLVAHFDDPAVALVAPRIVPHRAHGSLLVRYEAIRSVLDLGPGESAAGRSTVRTLVPSAAFVARTDALRSVGGFDEALRFGEDQDLTYRLGAQGWRLRYEPAATVAHDHRVEARDVLRTRVRYGVPMATLARRHGALMSAWRVPHPSVARLAADLVSLGVPAGEANAIRRRVIARALRTAGHAATRVWLPLGVLAATRSRAAAAAVTGVVVARHTQDWHRRRPPVALPWWVALRTADEAALATGTWIGAVRGRTATPVAPARDDRPRREPGDGDFVEAVLWLP